MLVDIPMLEKCAIDIANDRDEIKTIEGYVTILFIILNSLINTVIGITEVIPILLLSI